MRERSFKFEKRGHFLFEAYETVFERVGTI